MAYLRDLAALGALVLFATVYLFWAGVIGGSI